mmetsp:Transcript_10130/g.15291  ORF Transcript_10130/g.15291 Transcript_10130/m.15291 type:complete len:92 (-) Transcript_10130:101-376(-)
MKWYILANQWLIIITSRKTCVIRIEAVDTDIPPYAFKNSTKRLKYFANLSNRNNWKILKKPYVRLSFTPAIKAKVDTGQLAIISRTIPSAK